MLINFGDAANLLFTFRFYYGIGYWLLFSMFCPKVIFCQL